MNGTYIDSSLYNQLIDKNILVREAGDLKINPEFLIEQSLGFENIAIQQLKNEVNSRLDVDISSEMIRGMTFKVPLMSANMSTVTDLTTCRLMWECGGLGVLHRAFPSDGQFIREVQHLCMNIQNPAVSVGVGGYQFELAKLFIDHGVKIICIDIAHGYSNSVLEMAKNIKSYSKDVKVIVGNTINIDSLYEFDDCADAVKVGIAQGLACETKNTAGCTEKQFSAVLKFKSEAKRLGMPIISDGGIREPADFVKAIAAGASGVMAGSIFARCPESPAPLVDGKKLYAGMASRYVQDMWKGGLKEGTCPEGKVVMLDPGESLRDLVTRYSGALKSGMTYSGASNIREFHEKVRFVRV